MRAMRLDTALSKAGEALQKALLFDAIEDRRLLVNCACDGTVTVRDASGKIIRGVSLREVLKEYTK